MPQDQRGCPSLARAEHLAEVRVVSRARGVGADLALAEELRVVGYRREVERSIDAQLAGGPVLCAVRHRADRLAEGVAVRVVGPRAHAEAVGIARERGVRVEVAEERHPERLVHGAARRLRARNRVAGERRRGGQERPDPARPALVQAVPPAHRLPGPERPPPVLDSSGRFRYARSRAASPSRSRAARRRLPGGARPALRRPRRRGAARAARGLARGHRRPRSGAPVSLPRPRAGTRARRLEGELSLRLRERAAGGVPRAPRRGQADRRARAEAAAPRAGARSGADGRGPHGPRAAAGPGSHPLSLHPGPRGATAGSGPGGRPLVPARNLRDSTIRVEPPERLIAGDPRVPANTGERDEIAAPVRGGARDVHLHPLDAGARRGRRARADAPAHHDLGTPRDLVPGRRRRERRRHRPRRHRGAPAAPAGGERPAQRPALGPARLPGALGPSPAGPRRRHARRARRSQPDGPPPALRASGPARSTRAAPGHRAGELRVRRGSAA